MTWDNPQPIDPMDESHCRYCGEKFDEWMATVHIPQFAWYRDGRTEHLKLKGPCILEPFEDAQKRIVEKIDSTTPTLDSIRFEAEPSDGAWDYLFGIHKPQGIEALNGQDPVMYALHQMFDRVVMGYAKACVDAGRVLTFGEYDGSQSPDDEWESFIC